jgi:hypothetical protein
MTFVSYAFIKGSLYSFSKEDKSVFFTDVNMYGNRPVYGALFYCEEFDVYQSVIDAHYRCSFSNFGKNNPKAMIRREIHEVTTIKVGSLRELDELMYFEREKVQAVMYVANPNHPKIITRMKKEGRNRMYTGIDRDAFIAKYVEDYYGTEKD